jgi:LysM repeat protein
LVLLFLACWTASPCNGENKNTRREYIQKYSKIAIREMKRTGVPASVKMAQGILESGSGTSTLARKGNNHFGIKCHDNWNGATIKKHDNEPDECFRKYKSAEASWTDHGNFLASRQRYAALFRLEKTDYKGWARGLQEAGYATHPAYAERLIRVIEEERLHVLDRQVTGGRDEKRAYRSRDARVNYRQRVTRVNGIPCIVAREGDSFAAIASYFNISTRKLLGYNDKRETSIRPGMNVFLKAKKKKADKAHAEHRVKEGESAYWISQMHGVKYQRVLEYNRLNAGEPLVPGETISLRKYNKHATRP